MLISHIAKRTLTPFELNHNDTLQFTLLNGTVWRLTLRHTEARILQRGQPPYDDPGHFRGNIKTYGMTAVVDINGKEHILQREVGSQASFYEPWLIDGVRLWFDAAACAFIHPPRPQGIIHEKDWAFGAICRPRLEARFALQQTDLPIAPEPIGKWFDDQPAVPDIRNCYMGEDCWMGPYNGGAAHCGLDINMPKGTALTAPITFDNHYLAGAPSAGSVCGRWRGTRRWDDKSEWVLQTHHVIDMLVPEHTRLARGTRYATSAGTAVGLVEHTHFTFRIIEQGGDYLLDPWILFWAHANQK